MRIAAELFDDIGPDKRLTDRRAVKLGAALRRQGESALGVDVVDISTHGFRVEAAFAFRSSRNVWLKLPGLEALYAQVVWSDGSRLGCQFVTPLHPGVVDRLVASAS